MIKEHPHCEQRLRDCYKTKDQPKVGDLVKFAARDGFADGKYIVTAVEVNGIVSVRNVNDKTFSRSYMYWVLAPLNERGLPFSD